MTSLLRKVNFFCARSNNSVTRVCVVGLIIMGLVTDWNSNMTSLKVSLISVVQTLKWHNYLNRRPEKRRWRNKAPFIIRHLRPSPPIAAFAFSSCARWTVDAWIDTDQLRVWTFLAFRTFFMLNQANLSAPLRSFSIEASGSSCLLSDFVWFLVVWISK